SSYAAVGTENTVTETAPSRPAVTTDWEPTTYTTVNNFDGVTMTVKEGTVSSKGHDGPRYTGASG
ncbi:MAG: hypothetical protein PHD36_07265, partial [Desulfotomaculaceae bacterium]|nr:hypothetical protein [Desulfotomaculaceae bacterium]